MTTAATTTTTNFDNSKGHMSKYLETCRNTHAGRQRQEIPKGDSKNVEKIPEDMLFMLPSQLSYIATRYKGTPPKTPDSRLTAYYASLRCEFDMLRVDQNCLRSKRPKNIKCCEENRKVSECKQQPFNRQLLPRNPLYVVEVVRLDRTVAAILRS
ncbi:unnamed protein product [Ceratitis capitata]|uniref:(Mediterranean fruit fly) hypothetical protein n=1 Tax=Ceratitis capitata TaxID=7213 RepID=A0A811U0Y0_CERCA|nr:unnamed protein product [Ceratitis capitata]